MFLVKSLKLRSLQILTEPQWHRAASVIATGSTNVQKVSLNDPMTTRRVSVSPRLLLADKKLDDFRAKEEEKEAEFNKQPVTPEQTQDQKSSEEDADVIEMKNKILEASLAFVESKGWSRDAIVKGSEQTGFPGTVSGMFHRGGVELIDYYYLKSNQELVKLMREKAGENSKSAGDPTLFATWALKERLSMIRPLIKTWPQAIGIMTLPQNVPTSLANVLTLVDDICFYAGDRSINFNWYARRVGLAAIYKASELYMLQDSSPNFESTWKFLDRRIAETKIVHDVLVQSEGATQHLTTAVGSAFTTARNILGLNFNRR